MEWTINEIKKNFTNGEIADGTFDPITMNTMFDVEDMISYKSAMDEPTQINEKWLEEKFNSYRVQTDLHNKKFAWLLKK